MVLSVVIQNVAFPSVMALSVMVQNVAFPSVAVLSVVVQNLSRRRTLEAVSVRLQQ